MIALVTSHTKGKVKSVNLPFGVGKTTFAMWTSYVVNAKPGTYDPSKPNLHNPFDENDPVVLQNWRRVFNAMVYNVFDCALMLEPGVQRTKLGLWDDVPATAPAERSVPSALYKFKGYVTTTRPEAACLLMTASNRNEIAAPLRKLVLIEVIIAERGYYEVQKVEYHKNYRNPELDKAKLVYLEEGRFPALPDFVQVQYDAWRVEQKRRLFPDMISRLKKFVKLQDKVKYEGEILGRVVKAGGRYMVNIPFKVGRELHLQNVKMVLPKLEGGDSDEIE